MIKIENTEVVGWEHAIRGMRNPKNSWKRSDSAWTINDSEDTDEQYGDIGPVLCKDPFLTHIHYELGENDGDLMMRLANGGPVHAKYRRMITVYLDITAPLYWWKEFDTYKVGTVTNSCSTMHTIADKEFTLEDFSTEHLEEASIRSLNSTILLMNYWRSVYVNGGMVDGLTEDDFPIVWDKHDKRAWWQMIQLLPSSYNQKRTIMLNYEVLNNMYHSRKDHKLDEWREFCKWIEGLPYSEIITAK